MAEMVINATASFGPQFGTPWGVPLTYNGQYSSGWMTTLGGYGLEFSGTTSVMTDTNGQPSGFTMELDGSFTVYTSAGVLGTGTMPSFSYTSTLSEGDYALDDGNGGWRLGIHGSPGGTVTGLGPFGQFIAALDRVVYNGSVGTDYFDGSYIGTRLLAHGGDSQDQLYGAFRYANQLYGEGGDDILHGQGVGDYVDGGDGNDFITDGDGSGDATLPLPQSNYNSDTLVGGDGDDIIISDGGGDLLDGGEGNDHLQANATRFEENVMIGGAGDDRLFGGAGTDTAIFGGLRSQYTIDLINIGVDAYSVVGPDGSDQLVRIEKLQFDDGIFTIDELMSDAPIITSDGGGDTASISVEENTNVVTTVAATNAGPGATFTYSISGGVDADRFSIDAASGELSFVAAPDFENPTDIGADNVYEVVVQVSDGLGGVDTQALSVSVKDINEPQEDILLSASDVDEFAANGTLVGIFGAVDPDVSDTQTFELLDSAGGRFSLANGNHLVVANGIALDYEQSAGHQITVRATDSSGHSTDRTFTIDVADINPESVIGTVNDDVIYGGAGNDFIWGNFGNDTLVGGDGDDNLAGQYDVDVLTGGGGKDAFYGSIWDWIGDRITDYEYGEDIFVYAGPTVSAGYRLQEGNGETYLEVDTDSDGTFTRLLTMSGVVRGSISVEPATVSGDSGYARLVISEATTNTPPLIVSDGGGDAADLQVIENTVDVTTIIATDPDVEDAVSYAIASGPDASLFAIDPTTGTLRFVETPDFEAPADADHDNVYEVAVQASDGEEVDTQSLRITVENAKGGLFVGNGSNNVIDGTEEEDTIRGLGGADMLSGLGGADTIEGGNGGDTLSGGTGNDQLDGGTGNDSLDGGEGNDELLGGDGNDRLDGGTGDDSMAGGAGNDTYVVDSENDTISEAPGEGTDTVKTTLANYTLGAEVENLTFLGTGNFIGTGNDLANTITGGVGDDILDGGAGGDRLVGGVGDDIYIIESGDVVVESANGGLDEIRTTSLSITLAGNVEVLRYVGTGAFSGKGNGISNVIWGGDGNDLLDGAGGDDVLYGGQGTDAVSGGGGNDTFVASIGDGDDFYFGNNGTDTCDFSGLTSSLVIDLVAGRASGIESGTDQLNSVENVIGGLGADTLIAANGRNVLTGGFGDDVFVFQSTAACGKGASADLITDFVLGDVIDVGSIDANAGAAGDLSFIFAGEILSVVSGYGQLARGEIGFRYVTDADGVEHTIVEGNVNANVTADFQIDLLGRIALTAGDFLL